MTAGRPCKAAAFCSPHYLTTQKPRRFARTKAPAWCHHYEILPLIYRYQRGVIRIRGLTLSNPVCRKNGRGQIPMESKCDIPLTTTPRQSNKFHRDSLGSNHAASQLHKMPFHYQSRAQRVLPRPHVHRESECNITLYTRE